MTSRESALEWLQYAEADLEAAEVLSSTPSVMRWVAAFHCQQAVEKALKALLVLRNTSFGRTHNLGMLLTLFSPSDLALFDPPRVAALTVFAVEARYPADLPDVEPIELTEAFQVAQLVVDNVRRLLTNP